MSEQDRVRALLDEGKISPEEAEALLEALGDKDEADVVTNPEDLNPDATSEEGARGENKQENRVEGTGNAPLAPPAPPAPPGETPPPPPGATSPNGDTKGDVTNGLRWVRVTMFAGNLEVRVDERLEVPTTEGEVTLTQEGRDYAVRQVRKEDFLNNLLNQRSVELRLPAGYGVALNMKGGNVDLYDVPFLKGKMLAGNLDARALGGIQLDMKAGNLDASLKLTEGEHRLELKAGNGELRFLPGSSVTVAGEVKVGGVETRGGAFVFERGRNYVGGRFHGAVGAGRASLEVKQTAGNLELAVEDA